MFSTSRKIHFSKMLAVKSQNGFVHHKIIVNHYLSTYTKVRTCTFSYVAVSLPPTKRVIHVQASFKDPCYKVQKDFINNESILFMIQKRYRRCCLDLPMIIVKHKLYDLTLFTLPVADPSGNYSHGYTRVTEQLEGQILTDA